MIWPDLSCTPVREDPGKPRCGPDYQTTADIFPDGFAEDPHQPREVGFFVKVVPRPARRWLRKAGENERVSLRLRQDVLRTGKADLVQC